VQPQEILSKDFWKELILGKHAEPADFFGRVNFAAQELVFSAKTKGHTDRLLAPGRRVVF